MKPVSIKRDLRSERKRLYMSDVAIALLLTTIAGLSTAIGGLIALFTKQTNRGFLSIALGFSAGVMIYLSFMEILPKSIESLTLEHGSAQGELIAIISFFSGILMIALIDKLIPDKIDPHEVNNTLPLHELETSTQTPLETSGLMRLGRFTALAIAIHNFPEGISTFVAVLYDPVMALPLVVAIALHNIPEGIAVAAPIYYATGSKKRAFLYSLFSGLAEPLGALIGWLILMPFLSDTVFGIVFGVVSGIMIYISIDELLPTARAFGKHHLSIYGLVSGMAVMALSLLLL